MIAQRCGKKFRPERFAARHDFAQIPAVQRQDMCEIKSSLILQPAPPH
jgi:iron complex transport system substrate-binding protein